MITLVRAVQTAIACPSQWDAWDEQDNYYYLRFRHGYGTVTRYKTENWVGSDEDEFIARVAEFEYGADDNLGDITLEDFAMQAGIELAPGLHETSYGHHLADQLIMEGVLPLDDEV